MAAKSTPSDAREPDRRRAVVDAVLHMADSRGLGTVSIREVAAAAGVSIGTVQHYFPTKQLLLTGAYAEVIARLRSRLTAIPLGGDLRANLTAILTELLPLDAERAREVRVQLAFAAWAITDAELAEVRREAQVELRDALTRAFIEVAPDPTAAAAAALAAMSVADGIALHAVSSGPWLSEAAQTAALEIAIDGLVGPPATGRLPGG